MTANEQFDAIKQQRGMKNDAALADALGITPQSLSALRKEKTYMSDETAAKVAEMLRIPPMAVIAECHAARATNPALRAFWHEISEAANDPKSPLARGVFALC